ncbi:MAG: purine-nucleoside phosphorylase [Planctomycetaceae bacterium]|nr:purine-nucleoside phosphorylase [Planctomycetaceae bacterium]
MEEFIRPLAETTARIRRDWAGNPRVGIILGTGLGKLVEQISSPVVFPFETLPHFCRSTALGHRGCLVCGTLCGLDVMVMQGRLHAYEGYSLRQITYPVRVMHALGVDRLIVTSASGGMNPLHRAGQLMVLDDHINLMGDNPLIGPNEEALGPRYPDMSQPYDPELSEMALKVARELKIPLSRGVYVGVKGPNYETRAEYRFFRMIGGDVVGMSTVPEVLVAVHAGMRVLGLTTITNVCLPDNLHPVTGEEVVNVADRASRDMLWILEGVLRRESQRIHSELFQ